MTYDHVITMVREAYKKDNLRQTIRDPENDVKTEVFCRLKSITRSEFYQAAVAGLRPEFVFVVHAFEYNGEQRVIFDGQEYQVLRTYQDEKNPEEVELICGRG